MTEIFQCWGWEDWQKNTKMIINGVIWGPHGPEFCMHLSFISTNIFLSPKVFNFDENRGFLKVLGGIKMQNLLNREPLGSP